MLTMCEEIAILKAMTLISRTYQGFYLAGSMGTGLRFQTLPTPGRRTAMFPPFGHQPINKSGIETYVDYNRSMTSSYARCTAYMGAEALANSGIVKMVHDGRRCLRF